ncbi:hypothetical protein DE146DRAFT_652613 [Phaeosphaeria sp. MPI-PUGE-AT-0046c]|nr:hypothetical protein DE146DRAFT_652613 [Phaeosphaeria sp. MPI-PUGE-AT-0046c]
MPIMSWDLDVCMQHREKILVPFHKFVKPKSQLSPLPSPCAFPFFRLPIDLQLIVYEHCDEPTLFQLMHTCSRSRHAATKLFWDSTHSNQLYHCPDYHLFEHWTYYHVFESHCPEFALRITDIEIDMVRLEHHFAEDGEMHPARTRASTIAKAKVFWAKVVRIFPCVQRIVLTGCTPRESNPPPPGTSDEEYACIETVVGYAPAHVKVHIAFVAFPNPQRDRPPRNTLWDVLTRSHHTWRLLDPDWKPTRVLLPNRKWTVSPFGDHQTVNQQLVSSILEMRGIQWLMIESYARYAMQGMIHCPRLDCCMTFEKRDTWKEHLFQSGHNIFDVRSQSRENPMLQLFCYRRTPEAEKLAIEARQWRLEKQCLETARIERRVGYGYGPPGSEQRRLFEQEFRAQLLGESLFAPDERGLGSPNPLDEYMQQTLASSFCRSHVYHRCGSMEDGHICYDD